MRHEPNRITFDTCTSFRLMALFLSSPRCLLAVFWYCEESKILTTRMRTYEGIVKLSAEYNESQIYIRDYWEQNVSFLTIIENWHVSINTSATVGQLMVCSLQLNYTCLKITSKCRWWKIHRNLSIKDTVSFFLPPRYIRINWQCIEWENCWY